MSASYPDLLVESRTAWRAWLEQHHADASGVWAVTWKKDSGGPHVRYDDLVEEALCFGWVDSKGSRRDGGRTALLVTPRKPRSSWSASNKARVERLTAAGLMAPAGAAVVAAAKASGTWNALDDVERLVEPDDLRAALDALPEARRHWDAFPPSTRRGILEWIGSAKRQPTRSARVAETARLAAENVRANQWRQPKGAQKDL